MPATSSRIIRHRVGDTAALTVLMYGEVSYVALGDQNGYLDISADDLVETSTLPPDLPIYWVILFDYLTRLRSLSN